MRASGKAKLMALFKTKAIEIIVSLTEEDLALAGKKSALSFLSQDRKEKIMRPLLMIAAIS